MRPPTPAAIGPAAAARPRRNGFAAEAGDPRRGSRSRVGLGSACLSAAFILALGARPAGQPGDPIGDQLQAHQLNLEPDGKRFLIDEAGRASFLLVGGMHGDRETPALVQALTGGVARFGYAHTAVEMSPWSTAQMEASLRKTGVTAQLRGADIEEVRPHLPIRELAAANPQNRALQSMAELVKSGYQRSLAPQLLELAMQMGDVTDAFVGGISLRRLVLGTLEVESIRSKGQRYDASVRREAFMKELFISHYRAATQGQAKPKFLLSFGQSHLGRGIDERGVSTLGNFVGELAAAEGVKSFHVLLFAAGGKYSLGGLHEIDQRKDGAAFAFLAGIARYPATLFDMRAVRPLLHALPSPRSERDANLTYWADAYDAIVCYREITPAG